MSSISLFYNLILYNNGKFFIQDILDILLSDRNMCFNNKIDELLNKLLIFSILFFYNSKNYNYGH